jgi:hypothetical protein
MKKSKNLKLVNTMLLVTAMLIWAAEAAQAQITKYTNEAAYLAALANLGYSTFQEGFENDAVWGSARAPGTTASVTGNAIKWQANHPDTGGITTGGGGARTGEWGIYDPNHGHASGSAAQCDVDTPPANCLFHDGFSGTIEPGANVLHGVGGWITTNTPFAGINIILDNTTPVDFEHIQLGTTYLFFGVIDTNGFNAFEIRETESKVGDKKNIFGDDFTFGTGLSPGR